MTKSHVATETMNSELSTIQVGDTVYRGQTPKYVEVLSDPKNPYSRKVYVKVQKGIPFVRLTKRRHER